ncbi:merozoite surface protein 3b, putative [Plasmodium knowlesi strain H]|uniref:Merozoite surface protein 3b, putative n=3 Tax=Plasmodium knowlesi TaxID=5850 RepID=A0A5K1TYF7_PLAKH|nr:merozoite surface protein 3 [Plasmodium knowlesi strain H]OTN67167.1 putative Merozoite surface protein 3b [Plasmodium knowlesi]CAA9988809.1 merozoite surface protein 3 [Plasmodium knowlesi strain H]SBO21802.1 merozoite surface protein 3b, putative [Plasmodium knowlesi strain H]SBO22177.1 merozoite surface protein 3b, putative [Plasmodium knowlesi strain H]VVS78283.1 merozoite surface protein 3 [Plasmodium knowlesi strain H]|eukprot:XP_002259788.1 merozoite surface protein 3b, putative [Plasmodium knowlesi strain H]
MKRIWSFSLFIFFLNFYILQYSLVKNEIIKGGKPNIRTGSSSHGKNILGASSDDNDISNKNLNEENENDEETEEDNVAEPNVPVHIPSEQEKKQIEEIAEEAELLAEEAKMLADLATKASQKVITHLGNIPEENIKPESESETKVDSILTAKDAKRAENDAINAVKEAKEATHIEDAKEAKNKAEKAKDLAERAATYVKKNSIETLKAGKKEAEASELEKMQIPIPENLKPKKENLKKKDANKTPAVVAVDAKATPTQKEATPQEKVTEAEATPASPQPAAESKAVEGAINQPGQNSSELLYEEKSLKEGHADAEKVQEQALQPELGSPQQEQKNVFFNWVQLLINKIKEFIKYLKFW